MVHLCVFSGQVTRLGSGRKLYVTIFGNCTLRAPTLAQQVADVRQRGVAADRTGANYFVTFFGATSLTQPTLAQEYLELQERLRSGLLNLTDWDRIAAQLSSLAQWSAGSLTLFGQFHAEELPSEDQELEDLAQARQMGQIPDDAIDLLMQGVGLRGPGRTALVRQAIATAMSHTPA